ncbi:MAG: ABC transporter ATP-binding protein [Candidatus Zixiibacteriota bacterium]|nr:MAG: ABC transporter ATP-binding protein [candidate division Zixibacteria bacterium]
MNIVVIEDLTKIYNTGMKKGGITALDGVSLTIEQPEIFGLLGPNGAGKTTLFKTLLGITQVTSGYATIAGLPPDNPRSRKKVGYLPENHRFPGHLTGLGLLEFTGRLFGMSRRDIDAKTEMLLPLVGMDKWASTKISKYSKGMQQRIGLAQALMGDPEILFLDEPTDGVDPVGKTEIREVLRKIRDEGKSVILNSHLLSEVESAADRVAILSHGKIIRVGSVAELTSRESQYEVEADFGDKLFDIPEEVGKKISLFKDRLIVQLTDEKKINWIIDQMRMKKINIRSVKPIKITLEQSFIETVSGKKVDSK